MNEMNPSRLEEALHLLGEYLAFSEAEPVHLLVVGGSALAASGFPPTISMSLPDAARSKKKLSKFTPCPKHSLKPLSEWPRR